MKKLLLLAAAAMVSQMLPAQELKVGSLSNVTRLTNDAIEFENPQWSPDGKQIAFTEVGHTGLYVMNADGSAKKTLSALPHVGYMYEWSADSKDIACVAANFDSGLRMSAVMSVNVATAEVRQLSEYGRDVISASWRYSSNGVRRVVASSAQFRNFEIGSIQTTGATKDFAKFSVMTDGDYLYVVDGKGEKTPIMEGLAMFPVLSPDRTKVVFNDATHVCVININGSGLRRLCEGFGPNWVNDNQIVFELSEDDGHNYTASDLYMVNVDGSNLKAITTTNDMMEQNARISPDGKKIVFTNVVDGQVYVADFK